jgi:formamidopyrimidine-DNA glycosylase
VPELPDVEGFRRELAGALPGRRIQHVQVHDAGILRNTTAGALGRRCAGHYAEDGAEPEKQERLVASLDKGELRYADLRKLRGVWLADGEDDIAGVMGPQGPDALGIDLRAFRDALFGRHGRLKPTLMDQSVIAGLGNLLTDEICWRARMRPTRPVAELNPTMLSACTPR